MNLLERAQRCREKVERLQKLRESVNHYNMFIERRQGFAQARKDFSTAVQRSKALKLCHYPMSKQVLPAAQRAHEVLTVLVAKLETEPTYVVTTFNGNEANGFFKDVNWIAQQLEEDSANFWRNYATERVPALDDTLLGALARIPTFSMPVSELRQEVFNLRQTGDRVPASEQAVKDFQARVDRVVALWAQVQDADVPSAVRDFLNATASTTGAGLDTLTNEVFAWLRQHGLIGNFQVRTRS